MLPRVIIYNAVSLDGRIDRFDANLGLYYSLASRWREDATLVGAGTLQGAYSEEQIAASDKEFIEPLNPKRKDKRPLLIVPDSRGRIRCWNLLRKEPYWRNAVALCSGATPKSYLEYLRKRHVEYIVKGKDHVNLKAALEELNTRYKIKVVRVDSGGTLNGALLRAGLVSEVSMLVHPQLVGGISTNSIFRELDSKSSEELINLRLVHVEKIKNLVWLRYKVISGFKEKR